MSRQLVVQIIGDASKLGGELRSASSEVEGFGSKLKAGFAAAGIAAAAAVGAAFKAGLDTLNEMQDSNRKLQASLGLTAEEADRFKDVINDVYKSGTGSSIEQLNGDLAALLTSTKGAKSASDATIKDWLSDINTIADTFDLETQRIIDVTGRMVNSGLAKNMDQASDILTKTFQQVPPAMRELVADAIDEYGPLITGLGVDGPRAMGLLVRAAEQGQYGIDKMGDALAEFNKRAIDGSESTNGAFESIGLDAEKMGRAFAKGGKVGGDAFAKVVAGLDEIKDPAEKARTAIALFGTPLEDLGVDKIPQLLSALRDGEQGIGDFEGATQDAGDVLYDSLWARIEQWKRTGLVEFAEFLEDDVIPVLRDFGDWLGEFKSEFDGWAQDNSDTINDWSTTIEEAWTTVQSIFQSGADIARGLWDEFGDDLTELWEQDLAVIFDTVNNTLEAIHGLLMMFDGILNGDSEKMMDGIEKTYEASWQAIFDLTNFAITGLAEFLLKTGTTLMGNANRAIGEAAIEAHNAAWKGVADAGRAGVAAVITAVKYAFTDLPGEFVRVGQDAALGFVRGLSGAEILKSVASAGWNLGRAALGKAKEAIDSNSPSKEFEKLGIWSGQGFVQGLRKMNDKARGAMADFLAPILRRIDDAKDLARQIRDRFDFDLNEQRFDSKGRRAGGSLVEDLRAQAAQATAFTKTITQLRKAGLSGAGLNYFSDRGPDSLAAAQEILRTGQTDTVNKLLRQIDVAGDALARRETYARTGIDVAKERPVKVTFDVTGADKEMKMWIRKMVRIEGGGDVQVAFGGKR